MRPSPPTHVLSVLNVFLATDEPAAAALANPFPRADPRAGTGGLSPSCVFGVPPERKNSPRAALVFFPQPGGLGVFPPGPPAATAPAGAGAGAAAL